MGMIIAIANQKGGVGKTTTAINLGASLAVMKRRVLVVDMDPQGNATMGSGIDKESLPTSIYDVLVNGNPLASCVQPAEQAGYDLAGGNVELTGAEIEMLSFERREYRLKQALDGVRSQYDFIIIDCPPALGLLTVNGLTAADGILIPMQCEYYALEGLTALMNTIRRITAAFNPELKIEGLVRTMYDSRNTLSQDVSKQLSDHFGDRVYRTWVPRNVRLAEAPSYGLPILKYDRESRGAEAYLALAGEFLNRREGP